jgi:Flp pilus assembly protein TadD
LVQLERFEPQNRFIKMQMALHLVEQNQNEMAIQKLNEIAELSPSFGKTYFLLSTIYERQGDDKKAQYYYNKIEKNQPIYIEASIQRAKDIEHKSGLQSALSFLKKVDNSGSDTRVYLYISILQNKMGYKDQSIKTLRSVVLKNPNDVQILYFLGHLEGESGEMGRAILNMKRVIQLDPTHSDALNYLAFYYAENNILLDEAEKLVQKALEIKPDDGHYQDTMGWIYFHKGQFELAQKFLEKAYNSHPEEPVIAEHLAAVYSVKGLKDKARRVYTNLIEKGIGDSEKIKRQINSITSQK